VLCLSCSRFSRVHFIKRTYVVELLFDQLLARKCTQGIRFCPRVSFVECAGRAPYLSLFGADEMPFNSTQQVSMQRTFTLTTYRIPHSSSHCRSTSSSVCPRSWGEHLASWWAARWPSAWASPSPTPAPTPTRSPTPLSISTTTSRLTVSQELLSHAHHLPPHDLRYRFFDEYAVHSTKLLCLRLFLYLRPRNVAPVKFGSSLRAEGIAAFAAMNRRARCCC